MAQPARSDDWQVYRTKKKKYPKSKRACGGYAPCATSHSNTNQLPGSQGHPVNHDIANCFFRIVKRVNDCKLQLHPCIVSLVQCLKSLRPSDDDAIKSIVCYGLGSLEDSFESQAQLALVSGLREQLESSLNVQLKCYVFDPILTPIQYDLLERVYGFLRIGSNEGCSRPVEGPTLFYMPHMDSIFYNNLLESNWQSERLSNLVILGNSFKYIIDSCIGKGANAQLNLLRHVSLLDSWKEFDLIEYDQSKYESSFNQIVLQGISGSGKFPLLSLSKSTSG